MLNFDDGVLGLSIQNWISLHSRSVSSSVPAVIAQYIGRLLLSMF